MGESKSYPSPKTTTLKEIGPTPMVTVYLKGQQASALPTHSKLPTVARGSSWGKTRVVLQPATVLKLQSSPVPHWWHEGRRCGVIWDLPLGRWVVGWLGFSYQNFLCKLIEVLLGLGFVGDFSFCSTGAFWFVVEIQEIPTTLSQTGWDFRLVGGWVGFLGKCCMTCLQK